MKCKLSLIVEGIDRENFDDRYYLNEDNGRVLCVNDFGNFYIDNYEVLDDDLVDYDKYIQLPTQYEKNEYKMMVNFIERLQGEAEKVQLFDVIQGKGAFMRFKNKCINYGIINDWYKFKNNSYYELAKEWCICNKIEFDDDVIDKL